MEPSTLAPRAPPRCLVAGDECDAVSSVGVSAAWGASSFHPAMSEATLLAPSEAELGAGGLPLRSCNTAIRRLQRRCSRGMSCTPVCAASSTYWSTGVKLRSTTPSATARSSTCPIAWTVLERAVAEGPVEPVVVGVQGEGAKGVTVRTTGPPPLLSRDRGAGMSPTWQRAFGEATPLVLWQTLSVLAEATLLGLQQPLEAVGVAVTRPPRSRCMGVAFTVGVGGGAVPSLT